MKACPKRAPRLPPRDLETTMIQFYDYFVKLKTDRRAVTALEYGIIAGVLGLALITIFQKFGSTLTSLFNTIGKSI
jgi:Flp pilus assembly pilin Flp